MRTCNFAEILIKGQQYAPLTDRERQYFLVARAGTLQSHPGHIVTERLQTCRRIPGKILVGEKAHLRGVGVNPLRA